MKAHFSFFFHKDCEQKEFEERLAYAEQQFGFLLFQAIEEMPDRAGIVRIQKKRGQNPENPHMVDYTLTAEVLPHMPRFQENSPFYERPPKTYSEFPFDTLTIPMIASLFIESKKLGDKDFADACLKQLQTRKV